MKASELANQVLAMVAQHGDHEIGVDGNDDLNGPVTDLAFYMPSLQGREDGEQPHYLIEWQAGHAPRPRFDWDTEQGINGA